MATTMYFEGTVKDKKRETSFEIEFGRSNYYGEESMYLLVDGKSVVMDREIFVKIAEGMNLLSHYSGALDEE